jgi:hypothetical protein
MKKYNEEHHNLHSSPYTIWITKSMKVRWAGPGFGLSGSGKDKWWLLFEWANEIF